jgi:hypothetical protein
MREQKGNQLVRFFEECLRQAQGSPLGTVTISDALIRHMLDIARAHDAKEES